LGNKKVSQLFYYSCNLIQTVIMNLFVAKLNSGSTSEDLQKLFSHYGNVTSVRVIHDKDTGNSKRYGFVEMPNETEAKEALRELNETEFQESVIVVKESQPRNGNSQNYSNQRNFNRSENGQGSQSLYRGNNSRRNYSRDNDRQGNTARRTYENRY
jgi:RNA recognition motif-containing protein